MREAKRRYALECLRLQADSMQLAGDANGYNAQKHFVRMARFWSDLAVSKSDTIPARNLSDAELRPI
jgi:hypothetical protein